MFAPGEVLVAEAKFITLAMKVSLLRRFLRTNAASSVESPPTQPPVIPPLPPEPQEITFQASDGQTLRGYYYPAAVNPAPLVVFMHWMGGDMSDWYKIAVWVHNRGLKNPFPNPGSEP